MAIPPRSYINTESPEEIRRVFFVEAGGATDRPYGLVFQDSDTVGWSATVKNAVVALPSAVIDGSLENIKLPQAPAVTLKGNPTEAEAEVQDIRFGTHTFPLRADAGMVARSRPSFFGAGITRDPGSNSASVDNQTHALTASNGVARSADDLRLAETFGNSLLLNAGGSSATPSQFQLPIHTFAARHSGNIQARPCSSDLRLNFVSLGGYHSLGFVDPTTIGWSGGGASNIAAVVADIPDDSILTCHIGPGQVGTSALANNNHFIDRDHIQDGEVLNTRLGNSLANSCKGRRSAGGQVTNANFASLAGANRTYNTCPARFDSLAGGGLIAATALSGSETHNFNSSTARVVVELKGGGGGGRGASSSLDTSGAGGGEGATVVVHRTSPGSSMAFSIGEGGVGCSSAPGDDAGASASTVTIAGRLYIAGGGSGGAGAGALSGGSGVTGRAGGAGYLVVYEYS